MRKKNEADSNRCFCEEDKERKRGEIERERERERDDVLRNHAATA